MRILILNWKDMTHRLAGGAEVFTHEVAKRWVRSGHEVTQFSAAAERTSTVDSMDGVRLIHAGGRYTVYQYAERLLREAAEDFDLVIDEANTRPFFAHRHTSLPVLALFHQVAREVWFHEMGLLGGALGRYVLEPGWLREYRNIPTVTVSESSAASLRQYKLRQVSVIPQGVTLPEHIPTFSKESRPTVLFVGRLGSSKRPDHAVEAFLQAKRHIPDLQMWIAGTGPLESKIARNAGSDINLLGWVTQEEKYTMMRRAHAVLMPSVREGWGLVVDEAAACGTTTIGYNVPGLRDSIPAAQGRLVAPNPSSMAQAIVDTMPAAMEAADISGWGGGARSWEEVALAMLDVAFAHHSRLAETAAVAGSARNVA